MPARRPRLLDGFCRAGGSAMGYHRAGFDVVGVDIEPQPNYPFEFVQGDAPDFIARHGEEFDVVTGSPPCQDGSTLTQGNRKRPGWSDGHVNLIPETRAAMESTGRPFVIENVVGSRPSMFHPVQLCGLMWGLRVFRHRLFEAGGGLTLEAPPHPSHRGHRVAGWRHGVKHEGDMVAVYGDGGGKGDTSTWQAALGIDWTDNRADLAEAIPPAYTEFIGSQLLAHLGVPA